MPLPPDPQQPPDPIETAEEMLRLAMLASDVDTLDALIADDLLFTNHLGQLFGKRDDLDLHRSGVLELDGLEPFERVIVRDGGVAVASVRMKVAGRYGGTRFDADLRYTRVWRLLRGRWQIVAGHSSAVQA